MPHFTTANAKENAAKSAAVRRAAKLKREQSLASIPASADDQATVPLRNTHAILQRIDEMMLETTVIAKIESLAKIRNHLVRQLRTLSAPASLKNGKPQTEPHPEAKPISLLHNEAEPKPDQVEHSQGSHPGAEAVGTLSLADWKKYVANG